MLTLMFGCLCHGPPDRWFESLPRVTSSCTVNADIYLVMLHFGCRSQLYSVACGKVQFRFRFLSSVKTSQKMGANLYLNFLVYVLYSGLTGWVHRGSQGPGLGLGIFW